MTKRWTNTTLSGRLHNLYPRHLYNAEGRCRRVGHTTIPGGSTCTQCGAVEVDEK